MRKSDFFQLISWLLIGLTTGLISSCGKSSDLASKSKTNTPPVVTAVNILPEKPTQGSELSLSIQSQDPDGDPVTYSFQWMKNDEEIIGETKNSLSGKTFKKGDLIGVKVTPSDGRVNGKPFLSPQIKVLNSPPVIQEVRIEPKVAYVTDRLKANLKSVDQDGDFIYYTYQWEKNGVVLNEEREEFLEKGRFKKGDVIAVLVTPDDREISGVTKRSETLTLSNSPPLILSSPPTSVEKTTYIYQVRANDPDNDPITYTLKSGPKRMEMDKKTGLIRWEIRKEDKGNHSVEIEVSDDSGAKSIQRYTLTIDIK